MDVILSIKTGAFNDTERGESKENCPCLPTYTECLGDRKSPVTPRVPSPLGIYCTSVKNLAVENFLKKLGLDKELVKEIHAIFLEYFSEGEHFSNVEIAVDATHIFFSIATADPNYLVPRVQKLGRAKMGQLAAIFTPGKVVTENGITITLTVKPGVKEEAIKKAEEKLLRIQQEILTLKKAASI